MPMNVFWLAMLILFGVIEAATVGLASIWFAAGALFALIASGLGFGLWTQIGAFLIVSFVTLLLARPLAKRYLTPGHQPTNADRVIGSEAVVTEEINNLKGQGRVSVAGMAWTARSHTGAVIPAGVTVRVVRIEGVKVFVEVEKTPEGVNEN